MFYAFGITFLEQGVSIVSSQLRGWNLVFVLMLLLMSFLFSHPPSKTLFFDDSMMDVADLIYW